MNTVFRWKLELKFKTTFKQWKACFSWFTMVLVDCLCNALPSISKLYDWNWNQTLAYEYQFLYQILINFRNHAKINMESCYKSTLNTFMRVLEPEYTCIQRGLELFWKTCVFHRTQYVESCCLNFEFNFISKLIINLILFEGLAI